MRQRQRQEAEEKRERLTLSGSCPSAAISTKPVSSPGRDQADRSLTLWKREREREKGGKNQDKPQTRGECQRLTLQRQRSSPETQPVQ